MKNFLLFATGISFCIFISCQQTSSHKPFVELSSLELSEEEMPMVSISNDFACSFESHCFRFSAFGQFHSKDE